MVSSTMYFTIKINKHSIRLKSITDWFLGFSDSSVGKESACNAGDPSSILGSGRSAGEGISYPLQYSWASLVAQLVKNLPAMWETWVQSLVGKVLWRREKLPTPVFWPGEFPGLYSLWSYKESDMTKWLSLHIASSSLLILCRAKFLCLLGFMF